MEYFCRCNRSSYFLGCFKPIVWKKLCISLVFLIIAFAAGSQIVLCMCLAQILDKTYENGKKIDSLFKGDLDEN